MDSKSDVIHATDFKNISISKGFLQWRIKAHSQGHLCISLITSFLPDEDFLC